MGVGPEHGTNQNLHELPTSGYGFWVCYSPIRGTGRPYILCLLLNVVTESLRCVFILACRSDFEGKETKAQQNEGATRGVRGEERGRGEGATPQASMSSGLMLMESWTSEKFASKHVFIPKTEL